MSHLAAPSIQTVTRPVTAQAAAPAAWAPGQEKKIETQAAAPAAPAISAQNTPAPAKAPVSSDLMSALLDVQAGADHGQSSGHDAHVDPGHGGDHTDRGHHGKPVTPPPAPTPEPTPAPAPVIPSFDVQLPARAIAEANQTLADGRASDEARTAFVTAAVERRAQSFVAQGQAALAVIQSMQAQFSAFQSGGRQTRYGLYA